jgi:hypothetical protein
MKKFYRCGHCERKFKSLKDCEKHEAKECEEYPEVKYVPPMYLYIKNVKPLGFTGSGLFESKWHQFYYAKVPKTRKVFIIDNLEQSISHFTLTKQLYNKFEKGKLSLVPAGCCCATGNKCVENPIIDFQGNWRKMFKTRNKTVEFIKKIMET